MKKIIAVVILSLACFVSSGQSRYTTSDSLNVFCDKVMQTISDGKYSAAIQLFNLKSVMDSSVIDNIDNKMNEQMPNILPYYGKIAGYELIEVKTLGKALARRKYILKFEKYFLTFDFVLYNNNTGWTVSNFYYKDETKELF